MRIGDWSSDVCSSDLINSTATIIAGTIAVLMAYAGLGVWSLVGQFMIAAAVSTTLLWLSGSWHPSLRSEERRVGKSVSVRVDLGGRRIIKKKQISLNRLPQNLITIQDYFLNIL